MYIFLLYDLRKKWVILEKARWRSCKWGEQCAGVALGLLPHTGRSTGVQKLYPTKNMIWNSAVSSSDHPLSSSGSAAPCMFGVSSPFTSQDTLLSQQRVPSSSEVQDLVSSLPPINTVFMGAGGVQWRWRHKTSAAGDIWRTVSSRGTQNVVRWSEWGDRWEVRGEGHSCVKKSMTPDDCRISAVLQTSLRGAKERYLFELKSGLLVKDVQTMTLMQIFIIFVTIMFCNLESNSRS